VAVTARISGRDLGSTIRDVQAVLQRPGLMPAGVTYRLGGLYEQQRIAFRGLLVVIIAAIALVFLLLLFLYESLRVAAAMLLTTMLVQAAVFMGLWLTNTELNITSIMGMTMIVGIATEVAIFYYSEYAELPAEQAASQRLVAAGVNRMRAYHDELPLPRFLAFVSRSALGVGTGLGDAATAGYCHYRRADRSTTHGSRRVAHRALVAACRQVKPGRLSNRQRACCGMTDSATVKAVRRPLMKRGVYLGLLPTQQKAGGDKVTVGRIVPEIPAQVLEAYRGMRAEAVGHLGAKLELGRIR